MGCSVSNFKTRDKHSVKVTEFIQSRDIFPSKIITVQDLTSQKINCLKFSLKEGCNDEYENNLLLLRRHQVSCISDLNYIFNTYQHLEMHLTYLESKAHGVCIPNYDISKGFKVLIMYLDINKEENNLFKAIRRFPYIQIEKSPKENLMGIISAWENLVTFIQENAENSIKDSVNNIQSYINKISSQSQSKDSQSLQMIILALGLFTRLGSEILSRINECSMSFITLSKSLPRFVKNIEKNELHKFAGKTVVALVHALLASNYIYLIS